MARYKLSQDLKPIGLAFWVCCFFLACSAPGLAGERYALVIGVDQYERARDLRNPAHDARAIAARLEDLGFALYGGAAHINLSRAAMLSLMREFSATLPDGATALVFLAGHGLSRGGDTYLIPADDGDVRSRSDLADHAVALRALTGRLAARDGVHSIILVDACRANGLRGDGPGAGGAGDLVTSTTGSMNLIYAAAPGQIAADGEEDTSPFTAAVLHALATPNEPLEVLFRHVSEHLRTHRVGAQTPWMIRSYGDVGPVMVSEP